MLFKFIGQLWRRGALVGNNDSFFDFIFTNEFSISAGIDAIAGRHLDTERFHLFNILGIDYADAAASFKTGLIGEAGKIVDNTAVLFESSLNRNVLKVSYFTEASCKEISPFLGVFPKIVE